MSTIATLALALVAQHEAFTAGMNTADNAVKGFERSHLSLKGVMESVTTPTERYEKQVEQLAKWHEIGKINAEQYERALDQAHESMKRATEGGSIKEQLGEGLADLGTELIPAITAVEAIEKAIEHIKEGFEEVGQIGRSSVRLGISAEEFSRLKYAAEVTHVPVEALETDFGRMLNNIEKATAAGSPLAAVFSRLHLNVEQLKDAEPAEAFERIGEAIAHVANRAERMNDVREIFGKAGTAILPMIENMRQLEAESDKVGFTRIEEDVKKVEEAEKNMARATKQAEAAFMDLAARAAPAISAIAESIAHAYEGARRLGEINRTPDDYRRAVNESQPQQIALIKQEEEITQRIAAIRAGEEGDMRKTIQGEEELVETMKKRQELLARIVENSLNAGGAEGKRIATEAQQERNETAKRIREVEEDLKRLKDLRKQYGEDLDELFGGEAEPPKTKHKLAPVDEYGLTLKDWEEFFREQHRLKEEHQREAERDAERALRETDRMKVTLLHGEGDFAHRQGDRKENAVEVGAGVDPRFLRAGDEERADRKKQISLAEQLVNQMNDLLGEIPAVVTP